MMNKKIIGKVVAAVVMGVIAISSYTMVFANTNNTSDKKVGVVSQKDKGGRGHAFKKGEGKQDSGLKTQLDSLVKAGTITQEQEDKIVSYFKEKQSAMKAEMDKVKAMSEDERKAYMEQKKADRKAQGKVDMFKDLVAQNIITQEQADAITKSFQESMKERIKQGEEKQKTGLKTQLDKLVTAGTITQEQEDKITNYLKQKQDERKTEMDKIKAMSEADRKAYMEQKKAEKKSAEKTDVLKELVSQNIISQDQADAISKLFPGHKN